MVDALNLMRITMQPILVAHTEGQTRKIAGFIAGEPAAPSPRPMRLLSLLPRLVRRAVAAGRERRERSAVGLDSELRCDDAARLGIDLDLSDPQHAWSVTTDFDVRALEAPLEEPVPVARG